MPMKISVNHEQEIRCLLASLKFMELTGKTQADHQSRYDTKLNYFEYVSQVSESFAAEWAVADYLGLPYEPKQSIAKESADVGHNIEIKWTKYDEGQLIIYETDRNTDIAVLVTGRSPSFRIAGWIPVANAKKDRYRHRSQPTWWVTQGNLQPIENFNRSIHANSGV
jgi:hypothetical protein